MYRKSRTGLGFLNLVSGSQTMTLLEVFSLEKNVVLGDTENCTLAVTSVGWEGGGGFHGLGIHYNFLKSLNFMVVYFNNLLKRRYA